MAVADPVPGGPARVPAAACRARVGCSGWPPGWDAGRGLPCPPGWRVMMIAIPPQQGRGHHGGGGGQQPVLPPLRCSGPAGSLQATGMPERPAVRVGYGCVPDSAPSGPRRERRGLQSARPGIWSAQRGSWLVSGADSVSAAGPHGWSCRAVGHGWSWGTAGHGWSCGAAGQVWLCRASRRGWSYGAAGQGWSCGAGGTGCVIQLGSPPPGSCAVQGDPAAGGWFVARGVLAAPGRRQRWASPPATLATAPVWTRSHDCSVSRPPAGTWPTASLRCRPPGRVPAREPEVPP